jgi:hypothetical protein
MRRLAFLRLAYASVMAAKPPAEHVQFGPWTDDLWCWKCTSKICRESQNSFCAGFKSREAAKGDAGHHNRLFHDDKLTLWEAIPRPPWSNKLT